jgi:hypothetical protein
MVCPSVALTPESTIQRRFRTKVNCTLKRVQRREDHWAIVDLVGKGGHVRTIPVPEWVKGTIDVLGHASANVLFKTLYYRDG